MSKKIGYVLLIFGAAFATICLYIDRERRRDPNFKKKLRDKRSKLQKERIPVNVIPPMGMDPQLREAMIISEIQIAEKLMVKEQLQEAIVHFAHAISICSDPAHLLNCLKQTLPTQSYQQLLKILSNMYGERNSRLNQDEIRALVIASAN